ncbi:hypothetical protein Tco_1537095 [Tanacetum coccineum]
MEPIESFRSDASYVLTCSEYVDTTSFTFRGSELVRGASSSNGCLIYLKSFPNQRNLDSRVTDDSATEGFTPDDLSKRILVYKVSKVGSNVPSAKRANDVEGFADNVDDVDDQDDAHYYSDDNVNDIVRSFDLVQCF